jgi:hypothetical protein
VQLPSLLPLATKNVNATHRTAATRRPINQPRTVRNLTHSARIPDGKLARSGLIIGRDGALVALIGAPPGRRRPGTLFRRR